MMNNTDKFKYSKNQEVFEAEAEGAVYVVKVPAQKLKQVHHVNEFPFSERKLLLLSLGGTGEWWHLSVMIIELHAFSDSQEISLKS